MDIIAPQEGTGKGIPQTAKLIHCPEAQKQYEMYCMFGKVANYFFQCDFSVNSLF